MVGLSLLADTEGCCGSRFCALWSDVACPTEKEPLPVSMVAQVGWLCTTSDCLSWCCYLWLYVQCWVLAELLSPTCASLGKSDDAWKQINCVAQHSGFHMII